MTDNTTCPECGEVARVEWRCVLESTDGPIEHCRIRCGQRHWFLLPVEMLARRSRSAPAASAAPASATYAAGAPDRPAAHN